MMQSALPGISVIIPLFNKAPFVVETLALAFSQTVVMPELRKYESFRGQLCLRVDMRSPVEDLVRYQRGYATSPEPDGRGGVEHALQRALEIYRAPQSGINL